MSTRSEEARLEEARAAEQQADFARQEKILKLISKELTTNTTRVVEAAVKTVVQNSVLPSLEAITKNEVKAALNGQIAKGLGDSVNQVSAAWEPPTSSRESSCAVRSTPDTAC